MSVVLAESMSSSMSEPSSALGPEPGQAGQVVSVNDDVVESDRHAPSMRGYPARLSGTGSGSSDPCRLPGD